MSDKNKSAPQRAVRFNLRLDADNKSELVSALRAIATNIDRGELTVGVSGGYGSDYSYELLSNPEQTHEKYFAELREYLDGKRGKE